MLQFNIYIKINDNNKETKACLFSVLGLGAWWFGSRAGERCWFSPPSILSFIRFNQVVGKFSAQNVSSLGRQLDPPSCRGPDVLHIYPTHDALHPSILEEVFVLFTEFEVGGHNEVTEHQYRLDVASPSLLSNWLETFYDKTVTFTKMHVWQYSRFNTNK